MSFDRRAATWDASDRRQALAQSVAGAIVESVPLDASMHLLDFGAGTGLLTRRLLPFVGRITAVDTSQGMLAKLRETLGDEAGRVESIHGDIMEHACDACYDGIVSSMTMHHIADTDALMRRLYALLKPGGFLAVADLMPEDGTFHDHGNDGVHHFGFEEVSLTNLAKKAGFEAVA
ncbi:class I SAM-dependent methyltransferase, partial [Hydrogenimonas sp.]